MCGIGLLASLASAGSGSDDWDVLFPQWNKNLSEALARRGPDIPRGQYGFYSGDSNSGVEFENANGASSTEGLDFTETDVSQWTVTIHASVLHMRGDCPVAQPVLLPSLDASPSNSRDDSRGVPDCTLCWNGECYNVVSECNPRDSYENMGGLISSEKAEQADTILVANLLHAVVANERHSARSEQEAIGRALGRIHGEFAFILFVPPRPHKTETSPARSACIYYGRDRLGRRSLLASKPLSGVFVLSSVAFEAGGGGGSAPLESNNLDSSLWEEIPPGIVFRLDLHTEEETSLAIKNTVNHVVTESLVQFNAVQKDMEETVHTDGSAANGIGNDSAQKNRDNAAKCLLDLLDRSVERRVIQAPLPKSQSRSDASVAVLFSGGIDSVVIAALSHRHIPLNEPIDLINVCFYSDDFGRAEELKSPDRLAAILSYNEMQRRFPDRKWNFIAVDVPYQEVINQEGHIMRLISPLDSTMDFNIATAFWFAGRGRGRFLDLQEVNDVREGLKRKPGQLLRFARDSKSRIGEGSLKVRAVCIRDGCPRHAPLSGCIFQACKFCCGKLQGPISSYAGKNARLCPAHDHPHSSNSNVLRKSSFEDKAKSDALRENGVETNRSSPFQPRNKSGNETETGSHAVNSYAKILLSGVGADEQLAGYGRHRTTYLRGGYEALRADLEVEVNRLWTRNLGRDDRCLSDHGKEARFPYLDEDVMAFLDALPLEYKCDMTRPPGEGDKLVLRKVARMIGVMECASLVKRAIQFGSRIAKVSDKSRFGSCRRAKGQSRIVAEKGTN